MINVEKILKLFKRKNIDFVCGVPDSVLKPFSNLIENNKDFKHLIAVNEGSAVSLGIGFHLSTKKVSCIYLQNSGLGNAINPLAAISHPKVYSIPILLLIGWRGAPGLKDEPQHIVKGLITKKLLSLLKIKFCILKKNDDLKQLAKIINFSKKFKRPVACLVKNEILSSQNNLKKIKLKEKYFKRKLFISELLKQIKIKTKIISTTGFTSRELMQIRREQKLIKGKDFYMVGGMGHAAAVSLGASFKYKHQIICLDGDGSILMHLGSLRTVGFFGGSNFKHIILNNNAHESVGGQTTTARTINFKQLAYSIGYKAFFKVDTKKQLRRKIRSFLNSKGPTLFEVCIDQGSIENLDRPKNLKKIKNFFLR
jgi:phosphonopyruvate decarboxylase